MKNIQQIYEDDSKWHAHQVGRGLVLNHDMLTELASLRLLNKLNNNFCLARSTHDGHILKIQI